MKNYVDDNYKKSFAVTKKRYGGGNASAVKKLHKTAMEVEAKEPFYAAMDNEQLSAQTEILRQRYQKGESLDKLLPDAFAVCREAAKRVLHQRHYFVQILGGIAIHQGRICQMSTGEGKTLTETLPAYLNALTGKGVHIVTVNEYLATRDMEWMGKVFRFLGLTVGVTLSQMSVAEKKKAYDSDITYGTNSEFGFDYLRDNQAQSRKYCVQRGLNFVIIDEVDSILIDEARTPLIISGPGRRSADTYQKANRFVCTLRNSTNTDNEGKTKDDEQPNGHYVVDRKTKSVRLTDEGIARAEKFFGLENLSDPDNIELNHYINNALRAHAIMHRDEDYIVERGEVVIVDTFTGRKMEGRRFSEGLHQAIEAKEHLTVREEDRTIATITLQNYFRQYRKMSGMTGTAKTEEKEFNTIYNIDVVVIPTHLPMIRQDKDDLFFATRQGKLKAVVEEIKKRNKKGQPVLAGTVTVEKSEELSALLKREGIQHNVLNAKFHRREAAIIAQAGRLGAVTIATNMAGRGTDILLGGNAEFLARQEMKKQGYDDAQIEAAAGFVAKDEETEELQRIFRETVKKFSAVTDEEKKKVIAAGGLCVIGTDKHDSRRIDDQLRGRAGRQGDPGESVFFVSAEDDLLRIFGGDLMQRALAFIRADDNNPIQHPLFSKTLESAQKKVEGMHFSARKNVLQYDDVNNQQRKIIYGERNRVLDGADVHDEILAMSDEYARHALEYACDARENVAEWDVDSVNKKLRMYFPVEQPLVQDDVTSARAVCDVLAQKTRELLEEKRRNVEDFADLERFALLNSTDNLWMDEIEALDELRQGVGLQSIGQHDPLSVYKKEAYEMFQKLNEQIKVRTVRMLFFSKLVKVTVEPKQKGEINPEKKLNGPCPCGSGKKYKNCCYPKELAKQAQQTEKQLTKQEEYALKRLQRKKDKAGK